MTGKPASPPRQRRGGAIYAVEDVPVDVVTHRATRVVCGENLSLATGIFRLVVLTGADVQLVSSRNRDGTIHVTCRPPIAAGSESELVAMIAHKRTAVAREVTDEWWLWPFLLPRREDDVERPSSGCRLVARAAVDRRTDVHFIGAMQGCRCQPRAGRIPRARAIL